MSTARALNSEDRRVWLIIAVIVIDGSAARPAKSSAVWLALHLHCARGRSGRFALGSHQRRAWLFRRAARREPAGRCDVTRGAAGRGDRLPAGGAASWAPCSSAPASPAGSDCASSPPCWQPPASSRMPRWVSVLASFFAAGIALLAYIQAIPDASQAGLDHFIFGQAAAIIESDVRLVSGRRTARRLPAGSILGKNSNW